MSGFDYGAKKPDGQHERHPTLPDDTPLPFIRPVRTSYRHTRCGTVTTMGTKLAETYARKPDFYGATFCSGCGDYFPVGEHGEFVWFENHADGPKVGV